jgi:hypothetical protein
LLERLRKEPAMFNFGIELVDVTADRPRWCHVRLLGGIVLVFRRERDVWRLYNEYR